MLIKDKAGYKRERSYILEKWDVKVKTCHIADVKRALGLTRALAPNRKVANSVTNPCPPELWAMVEEAVMHIHGRRPQISD